MFSIQGDVDVETGLIHHHLHLRVQEKLPDGSFAMEWEGQSSSTTDETASDLIIRQE